MTIGRINIKTIILLATLSDLPLEMKPFCLLQFNCGGSFYLGILIAPFLQIL